jgi:nucleotide-binding universal stress UspA family protein
MIRTILVALDASPRAPTVFDAALAIADRFEATLHPFRVLRLPPEIPAAGAGAHPDALPSLLTQEAVHEMAAIASARSLGRARVEAPTIGFGQPWREILLAGERLGVDLIVVGSHGYHGLDRVLGTTAGKVANLAHRHVFVVHARDAGDVDASPLGTGGRSSGA